MAYQQTVNVTLKQDKGQDLINKRLDLLKKGKVEVELSISNLDAVSENIRERIQNGLKNVALPSLINDKRLASDVEKVQKAFDTVAAGLEKSITAAIRAGFAVAKQEAASLGSTLKGEVGSVFKTTAGTQRNLDRQESAETRPVKASDVEKIARSAIVSAIKTGVPLGRLTRNLSPEAQSAAGTVALTDKNRLEIEKSNARKESQQYKRILADEERQKKDALAEVANRRKATEAALERQLKQRFTDINLEEKSRRADRVDVESKAAKDKRSTITENHYEDQLSRRFSDIEKNRLKQESDQKQKAAALKEAQLEKQLSERFKDIGLEEKSKKATEVQTKKDADKAKQDSATERALEEKLAQRFQKLESNRASADNKKADIERGLEDQLAARFARIRQDEVKTAQRNDKTERDLEEKVSKRFTDISAKSRKDDQRKQDRQDKQDFRNLEDIFVTGIKKGFSQQALLSGTSVELQKKAATFAVDDKGQISINKALEAQREADLKKAQSDAAREARQSQSIGEQAAISSFKTGVPISKLVQGLDPDVVSAALGGNLSQKSKLQINQAREAKIAALEKEAGQVTFSELFAGLIPGQRSRIRRQRAEEFADANPAVFANAQDRAGFVSRTVTNREKLFDLKRINGESVREVLLAGLFGGGGAAAASFVGAATPLGKAGALQFSLVAQLTEQLLAPITEVFTKKRDEFEQAGRAYERSILGISASLQASTRFTDQFGREAGGSTIKTQLALQEQQAKAIQGAARGRLLPLGVSGSTEATIIQGVVSALQSRGFTNVPPDVIAKIAERVVGPALAQRPQLLENPGQFLKEIEDVVGGLPQARRTILGNLGGIRQAIPGIGRAKNGEEVLAALNPAAPFAETVANSQTFTAVERRLQGQQEAVNTAGGQAFLEALKPSLEGLAEALKKPEITDAATALGTAFGKVAGFFVDLQTTFLDFSTLFGKVVPDIGSGVQELTEDFGTQLPNAFALLTNPLGEVGQIFTSVGATVSRVLGGLKDSQQAKQIESNNSFVENIGNLRATRRLEIEPFFRRQGLLEQVGLTDEAATINSERGKSPAAQLLALRRGELNGLFRNADNPALIDPTLSLLRRSALGKDAQERAGSAATSGFAITAANIQIDSLEKQQIETKNLAEADRERLRIAVETSSATQKGRKGLEGELKQATIDANDAQKKFANQQAIIQANTNPEGKTQADLDRAIERSKSKLADAAKPVEKAEAKVRELESKLQTSREDAVSGSLEVQKIVAQILQGQRDGLEAEGKIAALRQQQVQTFLSASSQISSSFGKTNFRDVSQDVKETRGVLRSALNTARTQFNADKDKKNTLDRQQEELAELKRTATDDASRELFNERLIETTDAKVDADRNFAQSAASLRQIQKEKIGKEFQGVRAKVGLLGIEQTLRGTDRTTVAGGIRGADLDLQAVDKEILARQRTIADLSTKTTDTDAERETNLRSIENFKDEIAQLRAGKGNLFENQIRQQTRATTEPADFRIALRQSFDLIDEENAKRKELNTNLALGANAITEFAEKVRGEKIGAELGVFDSAAELAARGEAVPAIFSDPDQRERLKTELIRSRANQQAQSIGFGSNTFGIATGAGLVFGGSDVDLRTQQEGAGLLNNQRTTGLESANLSDFFAKKRAESDEQLAILGRRIGIDPTTGFPVGSFGAQFGVPLPGAVPPGQVAPPLAGAPNPAVPSVGAGAIGGFGGVIAAIQASNQALKDISDAIKAESAKLDVLGTGITVKLAPESAAVIADGFNQAR